MVCRISAGLGPEEPEEPGDPGYPGTPPDAPLLASVVRRGGGSSLSWGARLACLTRRGSPSKSPLVSVSDGDDPASPFGPPGPAEPGTAEPGTAEPGTAGSGPVSRESFHGGPEARPGRGEATGVIGVAGPGCPDDPGGPVGPAGPAGPAGPPGAAGRPPGAPGVLCSVQPGKGAGWSG
jgi:hypothetical protein